MSHTEPILQENKDRYVIFPVKHHDIWDWYKEMQAIFWTTNEIHLHQDISDWKNNLTTDERYFIKHILTFSTAWKQYVNQIWTESFINEVRYPEAKFFYRFQSVMENIHSETYSLFIDTLVEDNYEKAALSEVSAVFPAFRKKIEWALKWKKSDSFAKRLIAFSAAEGLFSSGVAGSIFWLKKRGLMSGLTFSNELILRDEDMHSNFAVHLHNNHLIDKVPAEHIRQIISAALRIEQEFIIDSLPVSFIGMDVELMKQHLRFKADLLLLALECEKEYGVANPLDVTEMNDTEPKAALVEKRAGEYQKVFGMYNEEPLDRIS